jgi:hypothetical protein
MLLYTTSVPLWSDQQQPAYIKSNTCSVTHYLYQGGYDKKLVLLVEVTFKTVLVLRRNHSSNSCPGPFSNSSVLAQLQTAQLSQQLQESSDTSSKALYVHHSVAGQQAACTLLASTDEATFRPQPSRTDLTQRVETLVNKGEVLRGDPSDRCVQAPVICTEGTVCPQSSSSAFQILRFAHDSP